MTVTEYEPRNVEESMSAFWDKAGIYAKVKSKTARGKDYYFLDGPPYTSGRIHLGQAWNKSLKDMVLRYKRMNGLNVYDRAGYDMHGLPTELKVQKKLGINDKFEIEKFGVQKFVEECRRFSLENKEFMNQDFKRLGVWMDFENAYMPIANTFIEGEWWLVKKADDNQRLYKGEKVMHWCADCSTALAKHELEYENDSDKSIFVKFKVKDKDDEYLIVWTTTPWTIPFNLGVMVNPDLEYVKARVEDETWIVAKALAGVFIQGVAEKSCIILEEMSGEDLKGLEYVHPLADALDYTALKKKQPKVHTVVLSTEYVDTSAGTGLVHMAPGCGPEDYEIGRENGIAPFNELNEDGSFSEKMGIFSGLVAKKDDQKFIDALKERGALIAETMVDHDYAHCWRCKGPVVFRTTEQWFFKVEDLKDKMIEANRQILWSPDWAGSKQFESWLTNLRDNGITRQRYWGTPVPIWECDKCKTYTVIGSIAELTKKAGKLPEDLHRPYIDNVTFSCRCTGTMRRVPDILDVWIDAGTTSWTCLDYPQKKELFDRLWPPDFILEGKDQIRGWFNLLMVASMVSIGKPAFKSCYMHGFINDALGRKQSKSLGNVISPYEVIDEYGADTLRYYMIGGASPGIDINYNFDDMKVKFKNLHVFWNLHKYVLDIAKTSGKNPAHIKNPELGKEEKFMLSRLNSTVRKVTEAMEVYNLPAVPGLIEDLFLELSRNYIQLIREKLVYGSEEEKEASLYTMFTTLLEGLKMLAIVAPFISEQIYQNLRSNFALHEESIHLFDWPKHDIKLIDESLENEMSRLGYALQSILNAREKAKINLRWPLQTVIIESDDKDTISMAKNLGEQLCQQANVKSIKINEGVQVDVLAKPNHKSIGQKYSGLTAQIIVHLAQESGRAVEKHIQMEGKYRFKLGTSQIELTAEDIIIEKNAKGGWQSSNFSHGTVYIDTVLSKGLEAEGFSREVARRIQMHRKKAGLQKVEKIKLILSVSAGLKSMLELHEDSIIEKVGAESLHYGDSAEVMGYHAHEKVKEEKLIIGFEKV